MATYSGARPPWPWPLPPPIRLQLCGTVTEETANTLSPSARSAAAWQPGRSCVTTEGHDPASPKPRPSGRERSFARVFHLFKKTLRKKKKRGIVCSCHFARNADTHDLFSALKMLGTGARRQGAQGKPSPGAAGGAPERRGADAPGRRAAGALSSKRGGASRVITAKNGLER